MIVPWNLNFEHASMLCQGLGRNVSILAKLPFLSMVVIVILFLFMVILFVFLFKIQLWSFCSLAQWPCYWRVFHLHMFLFPFVASVGELLLCFQFMFHFMFLNANKFLPFLPFSYSFDLLLKCLQSLVFVVSNGDASSLHDMLFMF